MVDLEVRNVGTIGYRDAFDLQLELVEKRRNEEIPDTLLLLEHPPVITMGRSADSGDVLVDRETLGNLGVEIHETNRGGEVTYHGPGQIVGYLIINLYNHQRRLKQFVHNLEQVFVDLLSDEYGISASRDDTHRGVWVGDEKITAIGIAVRQSITMHGFAFNVNTNLEHFRWIVACGIPDRGQTSLQKLLGREVPLADARVQVERHFRKIFGYAQATNGPTGTAK